MANIKRITVRRTDVEGAEDIGQFVQEIPVPGDRIKLKEVPDTLLVQHRIFEEEVGIIVLVERYKAEGLPTPGPPEPLPISRSEMAMHARLLREFLYKRERRTFLDESALAALATRLEVLSGLREEPRKWTQIKTNAVLAEGAVAVGQGLVVDEPYRLVIDVRFEVEPDLGGSFAHVSPLPIGYDATADVQRGTGIGDDALEAVRDAQIDLLQFAIEQIGRMA